MKLGSKRWKGLSELPFLKLAGWAFESVNWVHAESQQEHCILHKLTSWCSSNIHLLPCAEASINHKSVSQSQDTVVPLATTRSPSVRRQSMKDKFAGLNWIFHIQVHLLHLIRKEIFKEAHVSWMSKALSRACKIVQTVPLLGHVSASSSYSVPGLQNRNDPGRILFISVPLSSRERDRW